MSVRGLVTVVIGVVAFVVIDSLSKMGALWRKLQMITPLIRGTLNHYWQGNPDLAKALALGKGRDFTRSILFRMKRKSVPIRNYSIDTSQISSLEPIRAALIQWRWVNLPNSGNAKL